MKLIYLISVILLIGLNQAQLRNDCNTYTDLTNCGLWAYCTWTTATSKCDEKACASITATTNFVVDKWNCEQLTQCIWSGFQCSQRCTHTMYQGASPTIPCITTTNCKVSGTTCIDKPCTIAELATEAETKKSPNCIWAPSLTTPAPVARCEAAIYQTTSNAACTAATHCLLSGAVCSSKPCTTGSIAAADCQALPFCSWSGSACTVPAECAITSGPEVNCQLVATCQFTGTACVLKCTATGNAASVDKCGSAASAAPDYCVKAGSTPNFTCVDAACSAATGTSTTLCIAKRQNCTWTTGSTCAAKTVCSDVKGVNVQSDCTGITTCQFNGLTCVDKCAASCPAAATHCVTPNTANCAAATCSTLTTLGAAVCNNSGNCNWANGACVERCVNYITALVTTGCSNLTHCQLVSTVCANKACTGTAQADCVKIPECMWQAACVERCEHSLYQAYKGTAATTCAQTHCVWSTANLSCSRKTLNCSDQTTYSTSTLCAAVTQCQWKDNTCTFKDCTALTVWADCYSTAQCAWDITGTGSCKSACALNTASTTCTANECVWGTACAEKGCTVTGITAAGCARLPKCMWQNNACQDRCSASTTTCPATGTHCEVVSSACVDKTCTKNTLQTDCAKLPQCDWAWGVCVEKCTNALYANATASATTCTNTGNQCKLVSAVCQEKACTELLTVADCKRMNSCIWNYNATAANACVAKCSTISTTNCAASTHCKLNTGSTACIDKDCADFTGTTIATECVKLPQCKLSGTTLCINKGCTEFTGAGDLVLAQSNCGVFSTACYWTAYPTAWGVSNQCVEICTALPIVVSTTQLYTCAASTTLTHCALAAAVAPATTGTCTTKACGLQMTNVECGKLSNCSWNQPGVCAELCLAPAYNSATLCPTTLTQCLWGTTCADKACSTITALADCNKSLNCNWTGGATATGAFCFDGCASGRLQGSTGTATCAGFAFCDSTGTANTCKDKLCAAILTAAVTAPATVATECVKLPQCKLANALCADRTCPEIVGPNAFFDCGRLPQCIWSGYVCVEKCSHTLYATTCATFSHCALTGTTCADKACGALMTMNECFKLDQCDWSGYACTEQCEHTLYQADTTKCTAAMSHCAYNAAAVAPVTKCATKAFTLLTTVTECNKVWKYVWAGASCQNDCADNENRTTSATCAPTADTQCLWNTTSSTCGDKACKDQTVADCVKVPECAVTGTTCGNKACTSITTASNGVNAASDCGRLSTTCVWNGLTCVENCASIASPSATTCTTTTITHCTFVTGATACSEKACSALATTDECSKLIKCDWGFNVCSEDCVQDAYNTSVLCGAASICKWDTTITLANKCTYKACSELATLAECQKNSDCLFSGTVCANKCSEWSGAACTASTNCKLSGTTCVEQSCATLIAPTYAKADCDKLAQCAWGTTCADKTCASLTNPVDCLKLATCAWGTSCTEDCTKITDTTKCTPSQCSVVGTLCKEKACNTFTTATAATDCGKSQFCFWNSTLPTPLCQPIPVKCETKAATAAGCLATDNCKLSTTTPVACQYAGPCGITNDCGGEKRGKCNLFSNCTCLTGFAGGFCEMTQVEYDAAQTAAKAKLAAAAATGIVSATDLAALANGPLDDANKASILGLLNKSFGALTNQADIQAAASSIFGANFLAGAKDAASQTKLIASTGSLATALFKTNKDSQVSTPNLAVSVKLIAAGAASSVAVPAITFPGSTTPYVLSVAIPAIAGVAGASVAVADPASFAALGGATLKSPVISINLFKADGTLAQPSADSPITFAFTSNGAALDALTNDLFKLDETTGAWTTVAGALSNCVGTKCDCKLTSLSSYAIKTKETAPAPTSSPTATATTSSPSASTTEETTTNGIISHIQIALLFLLGLLSI